MPKSWAAASDPSLPRENPFAGAQQPAPPSSATGPSASSEQPPGPSSASQPTGQTANTQFFTYGSPLSGAGFPASNNAGNSLGGSNGPPSGPPHSGGGPNGFGGGGPNGFGGGGFNGPPNGPRNPGGGPPPPGGGPPPPPGPSGAHGAGHQPFHPRPFDPRDWSTDGKKTSKELKIFDGDLAVYDTWRMRVRNHFVATNCNDSRVFDLIENNKQPTKFADLPATNVPGLPNMDWQWIAMHIWTFTGNFLSDSQLARRTTLVGGEEFNGLEFGRTLFSENVGGSDQLANLERGHFIALPNCSNLAELEPHVKQWTHLKNKYGKYLPTPHLIGMLWSITPEVMKEDIKKQKHFNGDLDALIAWVFSEIYERTDNKLSKWNLSKLHKQFKPQTRNNTGVSALSAAGGDEADLVCSPCGPDMAAFAANMERSMESMVNAALSRNGRTPTRTPPGSRAGSAGSQRAGRRIPSASFKGCWCCGKDDHKRQDCPEFKTIKNKHGGKVPKDYAGAWEKSLESKTVPLKALSAIPTNGDSLSEHAETLPLWPVLVMPVTTGNKYESLAEDDDDDDDESEVFKALAALTPNARKMNEHASQRDRKSRSQRHLNIAHLDAIARDVQAGKVSLPELDVTTNSEFENVWALVDSGVGASVANISTFARTEPVQAPAISLCTANGEPLPHSGAHRVTSYHKDGTQIGRVFYDANVEMPILAVSDLSQEGHAGSEVCLRHRDGYMRYLHNGHRQHVVKRRGVYFTKMYVREPDAYSDGSGFIRPGHP